MRTKNRIGRYGWAVVVSTIALILLVTVSIQQSAADVRPFDLSALLPRHDGRAQIDGPIQLTAQLSPPAAQAGDLLTLNLNLRNQTNQLASPTVEVVLPPNLTVSFQRLPTGVSVNMAEG
ncbi:MAG: hypothetical protein KDD89_14710, partial [Anaerolineales bacterium]|nr:hypothetical protein [Anaerolineales bacterium]